ncbi:DUF5518 domain-containing protein [Halococcus sp. IIIV-5B]|uniref:DUF5518 domain-containing protein n=1 Tax=Halococcus sp. IIIV-5B TaxID=2321230 RepID=UPI001F3C6F74|nr:DUF5518 domain-containing protein [Halococcus sp. IIIV-5B]
MSDLSLRRRFDSSWKYGLIGGLVSIPLTIMSSTWAGSTLDQPGTGVLLGAMLAGYLAANASRRAANAGILAGLVGGVPAALWAVGWLVGLPEGPIVVWSNPLSEILFLLLVTATLIAFSVGVGAVGGLLGGWLSKKINSRPERGVGS